MKHYSWLTIIDLLHKSKIVEGFLGETKPATFAYTDVCEERRRVSTTKSPTRLTYAVSLISCLVINYCSTIHASNTNVENKNVDSSLMIRSLTGNNSPVDNRFTARIAIVDVQSILEHSAAIQSIRKVVDQIGKKIRQDLSRKDTELKEIDNLLMGKRNSVSESAFEQEVNDFHKKVNIVQKEIQDRKVRLEQAHAEGIGKVQETIIKIINDLAEKHNLDLVIPSTQVLFAKNTLNITQEVIVELNNKLKYITINYE